jgi:hypothetical protein
MWAVSVIFKVIAQSLQSRIGRIFAQSEGGSYVMQVANLIGINLFTSSLELANFST